MPKALTYGELLERLNELHPTQLNDDVVIAKGRKLFPLFDTAVASECKGVAATELDEMTPVLIANP